MASLGLWTLPFSSLARISPTFCSVASLPIESTSLSFLGWHLNGVGALPPPATTTYNSETAGASCWSPRRWYMDGNLGLRAEDAAPRSNAPRPRTARTSTPETRGQACWSRTLPVAMQPREGADPSLTDHTFSLRATPACCTFASLALRI